MACHWDVSVLDGRIWFVGAQSIFGEPKHYPGESQKERAEVIVPICQLDGLSVEQIGQTVLDLVPVAEACFAAHLASAYEDAPSQDYYKRAPSDVTHSMVYEELPYLERYINNEYVNQEKLILAISFLRGLKARYESRLVTKGTKRRIISERRKVVARDYNAIFMRIGRRDGFHCARCESTRNLQIDHVHPVSLDGPSDDDNLQLLCGSCNASKGATIVDFRRSLDEETQSESNLHSQQPVIAEDLSGASN